MKTYLLQRLRIELLFFLQSLPDALAESNRPGGHKAMGAPRVRPGYKDSLRYIVKRLPEAHAFRDNGT
jgi:hypothetical protein